MNNGQIFASKVRNFQYDHRFLFRKERGGGGGTLERTRRYVCKSLLKKNCQDSNRFGIYQVAYK